MLLHDFLNYHARERGETDFAVMGAKSISYREAGEVANQVAHALIGEGLAKGDRFALLSKNSIEHALLFFAASKAGAPPVPLNYRLAPPELAYIINDAGAKVLIVSAEYVEAINSVRNQLKTVQKFIAIDAPDGQGFDDYRKWYTQQPTTPPEREVRPTDDLYQMYTSGTTGHPKGAVVTHHAVTSQITQFAFAIDRQPGERTLIVAPLYHAAAAITALASVATGGTLYIQSDFNPVEVVAALSSQDIAHTTLVPAMIQACLFMVPDVKERKYDSLRSIAYGASPIAENVLRMAIDVFKCNFYQGYGMTETTAVLCILMPEDHRRALAGNPGLLLSAGRPVLGTEVKIVDEDDNEVPRGTIGEICGRGPQLMSGYWNLPEASEKALWRGWMHTGDAGIMDEEGFVYVQDRVKDMIISGGENVYPREVENALFEHPAVADAAVIGVPSDQWGEAVKAIVVLKKGHEVAA
jgi:acyl-CoA synthetase (AMP-forming)/AMP-acid ligase II